MGLGAAGGLFPKILKQDNIFHDRNYCKTNCRPNKNINIKQL
jgi:hypothetical protein